LNRPELEYKEYFKKETKKKIEHFRPIVIVEIQGVKNFVSEEPLNDVYIIWRKR
jgi:hypothetical protein